MKVGVIDYGVGNLGSVLRALEELRVAPVLVNRAADMHATDCLILPGVGNFADCARLLDEGGWTAALRDEVLGYKRPLLGVCVGMQLLADNSTEGAAEGETTPGLGFVPGQVRHLRSFGCTLRVPHVGWNSITRTRTDDHLLAGAQLWLHGHLHCRHDYLVPHAGGVTRVVSNARGHAYKGEADGHDG